MPDLTESCWLNILRQIRSIPDLPEWMSAVLSCSHKDLAGSYEVKLHAGKLASIHISTDIHISVELITITKSYIDWLDEQIHLAARGPDWNVILRKRRKELAEYVDIEVIRVNISRNSGVKDAIDVISLWLPTNTKAGMFHYELHLS